jgi:hypothetical protein
MVAAASAAKLPMLVPLLALVGVAADSMEDLVGADAKAGQQNGIINVPTLASLTEDPSLEGPCYMDDVAFDDPDVTKALPSLFLANPRDCQVTCETSPFCHGFTYTTQTFNASENLPKVPAGACYLFGEGKTMVPQEHSISGPKYCDGEEPKEEEAGSQAPQFSWNGTGPPRPLETPTWVKKKVKEIKAAGRHVKKAMKALGKHLYNMDVCDGPRCCGGSRCHNSLPGFDCYKTRGTTSCIGASITPFKWGTCECESGACSKEGTCPDSILMQKYEQSAVGHWSETGLLSGGDRNGATSDLVLVAAAGVALFASVGALLAMRLRPARNQAFGLVIEDVES